MSRYEIRDSRRPPGSHPYYQFGVEKRWPYAWHGGAGGVLPGHRASAAAVGDAGEFTAAGNADMLESGLDPNSIAYPAFNHTLLHDPISYEPTGDLIEYGSLIGASSLPQATSAGMKSYSPNRGQTRLSNITNTIRRGMGDYELLRPAGPEPLDPNEATLSDITDLSSSEGQLVAAAVAAGLVWWFFIRKKKRKNPGRRRR